MNAINLQQPRLQRYRYHISLANRGLMYYSEQWYSLRKIKQKKPFQQLHIHHPVGSQTSVLQKKNETHLILEMQYHG